MALARITDFTAGQPILSSEVDAEFNQLVNALNGSSSDKDITMTLSHGTNPPLTLNQTGAGPIQSWKKSGTELVRIENSGDFRVNINAAGSALATVGGKYQQSVTPVGNVGAGEDQLHSFNIAGNVLATNGDSLFVVMSGSLAANANSKTINIYFGGTNFFTVNDNYNDGKWTVFIEIVRLDSDSVLCIFSGGVTASSVVTVAGATQIDGLDFTATLVLRTTGQGTSNNDVTHDVSIIRAYPAAT